MIGLSIAVSIFQNLPLLLSVQGGEGGESLTIDGEPITINGIIINDMAALIEELDKRTIALTIPVSGKIAFNGAMCTPEITAVEKRGIFAFNSTQGIDHGDWELDGGADPTSGMVYGTEGDVIYLTYNI